MRLSPLSVPYRAIRRGASLVTAAAIGLSGASMLGGRDRIVAGAALLGVVALVVAYETAYYRRYEYRLSGDSLDIQSGVFSRRNREIPLRRVQNVDVSRNVVQRALGIAAVRFETAGGSETEAAIRFVAFEEAKRLQREVGEGTRASTDGADAETLFALSPRELALVGVFSFDFRVPGALLFLLSGSVPAVPRVVGGTSLRLAALGGLAVLVAVVVVSWVAGGAVAVLNYHGFTLRRVDDELQYERGLFRRYDGTIPLGKVQSLTVEDDPLKRRFGYATLSIETAGYAPGGGGGGGSEAAVPLASRERVRELAASIEPTGGPDLRRPPRRVRRRYAVRYLLAVGLLAALLFGVDAAVAGPIPWYLPAVLLPAVPVAAHYKWAHRGHWLGDAHFVSRNGVLARETRIVPYDRVQTVIDARTAFQRRWQIATVTADTAGSSTIGGGHAAAAVDVAEDVAAEVREELAARVWQTVRRQRRPRERRNAPENDVDSGSGESGFEFGATPTSDSGTEPRGSADSDPESTDHGEKRSETGSDTGR